MLKAMPSRLMSEWMAFFMLEEETYQQKGLAREVKTEMEKPKKTKLDRRILPSQR